MASKKKLLTSGIAVVSAAALLFGGTFAWQSISQTALNEISASVNPGGRLHDDFNDITYKEDGTKAYDVMTYNKDVYVENFTERANNGVQVFARVRLDQYMELGQGAGLLNEDGSKATANKATPLITGTSLTDKNTWKPYVMYPENAEGQTNPLDEYWTWEFGGKTVYMPTFNKNKDSLEADINGTSADNFASFADWTEQNEDGTYLSLGSEDSPVYAIYDEDTAPDGQKETDELAEKLKGTAFNLDSVIYGGEDVLTEEGLNWTEWSDHIKLVAESHTAQETLETEEVMTMSEYISRLYAPEDDFDGTGNFWVWDTDGWAYWANPIDPETATGPLLTGLERTDAIINQDWYYAINVVAQFITGDDLGRANQTGFYEDEGSKPTGNALALLNAIGVDVGTTVNNEEELLKAMAQGESAIILTRDITLSAPLTITGNISLNLDGNGITSEGHFWNEGTETWSLISVDGGSLDIYNNNRSTGGVFADEDDCFCVDVRNGGKLTINGGTFKGNISAVYVFEGEATINDGYFFIQQTDDTAKYKYLLNCYDENYAEGKAKITVNGGNFTGGPWSEVSDDLYDGFMSFYDGFDPAVPCEADQNSYLGEGVTTTRTREIDTERFYALLDQGYSIPEIEEKYGIPQRWLVMVVPAVLAD